MKLKYINHLVFLFTTLLFLTGCQSKAPSESITVNLGETPALGSSANEILIEGRLIPKTAITLSFAATGHVQEILVHEGELVKAGQLIARLGGRQQAEAAIKVAEMELLIARQALQSLNKNQAAAENQAFLSLNTARQSVQDAQTYLDSITGDHLQNEIEGAKAQLVIAQNRLDNATDNYEEYSDEPETDTTRASYRLRLTEAQRTYDEVVRQLDDLRGEGYIFIFQQAQNMLEGAKTQLQLADEQYAKVSQGPDADALNAANARIDAATASLVAAQTALENFDLRAPAAGTLAQSNFQVGELVTTGQPVGVLADLSEWYVETIDLTEIDIVKVHVGQIVQVTADALPEKEFYGKVVAIRDTFQEIRGDIAYLTRIKLDHADPSLRWGMTVLVTFQQSK